MTRRRARLGSTRLRRKADARDPNRQASADAALVPSRMPHRAPRAAGPATVFRQRRGSALSLSPAVLGGRGPPSASMHKDVKPAKPPEFDEACDEGRAGIVDFGRLELPLDWRRRRGIPEALEGTLAYIAPADGQTRRRTTAGPGFPAGICIRAGGLLFERSPDDAVLRQGSASLSPMRTWRKGAARSSDGPGLGCAQASFTDRVRCLENHPSSATRPPGTSPPDLERALDAWSARRDRAVCPSKRTSPPIIGSRKHLVSLRREPGAHPRLRARRAGPWRCCCSEARRAGQDGAGALGLPRDRQSGRGSCSRQARSVGRSVPYAALAQAFTAC